MDSEQSFWVNVWRTVAIGLVSIVAVMGGCTVHKNEMVKSMVASGADPIKARCAVDGDSQIVCAILAAKGM